MKLQNVKTAADARQFSRENARRLMRDRALRYLELQALGISGEAHLKSAIQFRDLSHLLA
jgi:hypothetical protein